MFDAYAVTSLRQGAIDGPRMPITLSRSCVVKYNDTSIYILGGIQNYTRKYVVTIRMKLSGLSKIQNLTIIKLLNA